MSRCRFRPRLALLGGAVLWIALGGLVGCDTTHEVCLQNRSQMEVAARISEGAEGRPWISIPPGQTKGIGYRFGNGPFPEAVQVKIGGKTLKVDIRSEYWDSHKWVVPYPSEVTR
jgi:hypothetical protein